VREELFDFLETHGWGCDPEAVEALPGDLSQRHYFRVRTRDGRSMLVAHYPEEMRATQGRFVEAARLLVVAGVAVPEVLATDSTRGFMALADLGERTVYDLARAGAPVGRYVLDAIDQAARVAALDGSAVAALGSPPLDRELLRRELRATFEHVLDPRGLAALGGAGERFRAALHEVCDRLGDDPLRPCHRDFMARNLMPLAGDRVAVIDFQDLRFGPPAYDAASLLNDSLFPGADEEERMLAVALRDGVSRDAYSRAVVQRTLKAAGTFARFAATGKTRHLPLIAPTLARAVPHLSRLPETSAPFVAVETWWRERLEQEPFC